MQVPIKTMNIAFIGPTESLLTVLAPPKFDAHVKDWRWNCYATGNYHYWPEYSNRIVYGSRSQTI